MNLLRQQLALQRGTYGVDPHALQGEELVEYVRFNVLAAIKELTEMLDQVDGWKPWQTEREHAGEFKDRHEFIEEGVDVLHFLLNLLNVSRVEYDALIAIFTAKQRLNARRQQLGYAGVGEDFDLEHPQEVA